MKFNELTQYMIEVNGVIEIRDLPVQEEKHIEQVSEPYKPIITIEELKQQLSDTDYKIIKCYEYQMAGIPLPYDIQALHTERQAVRDKIAELQGLN